MTSTSTPLATVNGEPIDIVPALRRSFFHDESFLTETVTNELVRQYAEKAGIANSDAELQLAVDEVRYGRGLASADTGRQWLHETHQTLLSLQHAVDLMLLYNKVRGAISPAEVEAHYAEHKLEYEAVDLYSIRVDSESKAAELQSQISGESANFHLLAMEHSQDEESRHLGGYVGRLPRAKMTGVVEAAVFASRPPGVIGPIKTEQGWNLFKVTTVHRPTLAESEFRVRGDLMQRLIAKLIADAAITYPALAEEQEEPLATG